MIQHYEIFFHPNSKIRPRDTKLCVGVSVAYMTKPCIHNYYHDVRVFEKLKDKSYNAQNIKSCEMTNILFETYKNTVMPHGKYMFQTSYVMAMATMCAYPL